MTSLPLQSPAQLQRLASRQRLLVRSVVLTASLLCTQSARSQESEASPPSASQASGASMALSAGLFVPPQGGHVGAAVAGEVGYQLPIARFSLTTSGRVVGFFAADVSFAAALLSVRAQWPLEMVSPFMLAAVGPGFLTTHDHFSIAYQVGGGALVGITRRVAIGLEASYTQLGTIGFRQLSFGPVLRAMLD